MPVPEMEEALARLQNSLEEKEFLKLTRTLLRILQNILNEPDNAKYQRIRSDSRVSTPFALQQAF